MSIRCICRGSSRFPLCDGSHTTKGWSCAERGQSFYGHAVISSQHYRSLAQKWASHHQGIVVEEQKEAIHCKQLWILCDGSDLDSISYYQNRVHAAHTTLVSIDISIDVIQHLSPADTVMTISEAGQLPLWAQLIRGVKQNIEPVRAQKIFLSHAVVDEAQWITPILSLRESLGMEIFSCSDSITAGGNWYAEITDTLAASDWVLCLLSTGFVQSSFCAFEMGMARALNKKIYIVSTDGIHPPSYLQDMQMEDIPRYCSIRPWLSSIEAVLECVLHFASKIEIIE